MVTKSRWIGIAVTTLVVLLSAYVTVIWHSRRSVTPQVYAVEGQLAREASVRLALTLGSMTRVQSGAGIAVGILDAFYKEDIRDLFPGVVNYDRDRDALLWCYGFKPAVLHAPDGLVNVVGSGTNELLWYCKIPRTLADKIHWMTASTNEADSGKAPR